MFTDREYGRHFGLPVFTGAIFSRAMSMAREDGRYFGQPCSRPWIRVSDSCYEFEIFDWTRDSGKPRNYILGIWRDGGADLPMGSSSADSRYFSLLVTTRYYGGR